MTKGHDAVHTRSHCSGGFPSITAAMPDAMGAAGKQVGVERSRLIACIHTVEVERPDGSPKVDFAMLLDYSGAKSWSDLLIWAHNPPIGVYRTAIVQGLSIAHGRGGRRQICP